MGMRGEQQMLLQPRMLQSIEVLQLASLDLGAYLQEAALENEALSVGEAQGEAPGDLGGLHPGARGTWADAEAHDEMLRNQPNRARSLMDVVEEQLSTADLEPQVADWVRFLIGCLDASGYLSADDEKLLELARASGLEGDEALLAQAIAALQGLEPRGIGARDAIEAMLLQLDPNGDDYGQLCELLENFLEDLAKNRMPAVARALDIDLDELKRLIDELSGLDPRPAGGLVESAAPVIVPDVVVEWTGRTFEVRVTSSALPSATIDEEVARLASDRAQPAAARRYLRGKIDQARWIVEAVAQRGLTLARVAHMVFDHQRGFLQNGPGHLRPLRMSDVADGLEVHLSTVSRAVSGKHVQTPWGIFGLREFFQASTGSGPASEGTARDDVRRIVAEIFAAEDRSKPLSDDEVVSSLGERGIRVARRTVTKYRKELGIPSSYRRREF